MSDIVRCHSCKWLRTEGPCYQYYYYCGLDEDGSAWERVSRWKERAGNEGMRYELDGTCALGEPRMPELLPCPFCGGNATVIDDYSGETGKRYWQVWHECGGLKLEGERPTHYGDTMFPFYETPWYESELRAREAWNRRA